LIFGETDSWNSQPKLSFVTLIVELSVMSFRFIFNS
jgi:hypothetical protein